MKLHSVRVILTLLEFCFAWFIREFPRRFIRLQTSSLFQSVYSTILVFAFLLQKDKIPKLRIVCKYWKGCLIFLLHSKLLEPLKLSENEESVITCDQFMNIYLHYS